MEVYIPIPKDKGVFMRALKEKISITIDGDLLEKLEEVAEKDDRSLSQYINLVLKEHIKHTESDIKKGP